jgi:hypothetical protein
MGIAPHQGQSYVSNLERFIKTGDGRELIQNAAENSNFGAELAASAVADWLKS